jgi:hypothetical protein
VTEYNLLRRAAVFYVKVAGQVVLGVKTSTPEPRATTMSAVSTLCGTPLMRELWVHEFAPVMLSVVWSTLRVAGIAASAILVSLCHDQSSGPLARSPHGKTHLSRLTYDTD